MDTKNLQCGDEGKDDEFKDSEKGNMGKAAVLRRSVLLKQT